MNTLLLALTALAAVAACIAAACAWVAMRRADQPSEAPRDLTDKLLLIQAAVQGQPVQAREEFRALRDAADLRSQGLREELRGIVATFQQALEARFDGFGEAQKGATGQLRKELTEGQVAAANAVERSTKAFSDFQRERLDRMELAQKAGLEAVAAQLKELREAGAADAAKSRQNLAEQVAELRRENGEKLEQMRATVDEKLQSTLDQRLDANFKQVSDRLESVQKGLGEMQSLASGVGDLKRVLTNVKARGTWGEVQLGALLEDSLNVDQYASQVQIKPRSAERVDFAVRLPGHDDQGQVWLPIDCKFPHEDYARLLAAQEAADPAAVELAGKALERAVAAQAKTIADKYISPPFSTDFAYMYLPTEGLFAEIVRRDGFTAELRSKHKVEVAGPSTLTALLNSLRVGFKSLQIQKKSSEVWTELGKVKSAFEKYGDALEAVDKKLNEAKSKVSDVSDRHRAVLKSLRNVESIEALEPPAPILALEAVAEVRPEDAAA
jgi:DNA recombination protein RmuC